MAENYQKKIRDVVNYINTNLIAETPRNIYDPEQGIEQALTPSGKLGKNKEINPAIRATVITKLREMG